MIDKNWKTAVAQAKNGNETMFNSLVNEMYQNHYYNSIQKLTKDSSVTREVYTSVMTKFWERFILKGEPLPSSNLKGYIYNMSRNAFVDLKRKAKRGKECELCTKQALNIARDYALISYSSNEFSGEKYAKEQNDYETKMKLLQQSILQLEERCQEIIRRNVLEGELLKDLKNELGFTGTYQSIVEKKKRCMRRLSKLMFSSLEKMGELVKTEKLPL